MTLYSVAAQNASLDNDYGATKGPNAAAAHEVALFTNDPDLGGVELDAIGGYARVVWTNNGTNWPAASGGQKTSAPLAFPDATDAWSDTAKWYVLYDAADSTTQWDGAPLSDEISITAAEAGPIAELTIYYNNTGGF